MTEYDQIRTLAGPARLEILEKLNQHGAMPASELIKHLEQTNSAAMLSGHLNKLRMTLLINADTRASRPVYSVNDEAVKALADKINALHSAQ